MTISSRLLFVSLALAGAASPLPAQGTTDSLVDRGKSIPADFPHFQVDGKPELSRAVRDMFWQHYSPTPKATLWDEWLLPSSLWPATKSSAGTEVWRKTLLDRHLDPDGYVATYQHQSIAHQRGWPFPHWGQGQKAFGWHFSFKDAPGPPWRPDHLTKVEDWVTTNIKLSGVDDEGLRVELVNQDAQLSPAGFRGDAYQAPFMQLRWKSNLPITAQPFLEWTTSEKPDFAESRRMYFEPAGNNKIQYTMIPMYHHPEWKGEITGLRLNAGNAEATGTITLQALFSQYDTRHNVNNPSYVVACADYFELTHDLNFLRDVIEKLRMAMRFMESEFGTDKDGIVTVKWIGHEGTSGVRETDNKNERMISGRGVGNNYWDLLPFGQQDSYATIRHYHAALKMAELEEAIAAHPGWNIAPSPLMRPASHWRAQAALGKKNGNERFFNPETGRFTLGIDSEGKQADFGYTFLNLEAIYYDFASPEHEKQIMQWIDGERAVTSDTAQTTDIYHWRFAPRASTKRNLHHYGWFWHDAGSIPFGDQVQDGGAVLGFSYHDLIARLKVNGPEDAARRLEEIMKWYGEAMNEGGYRAYYAPEKNRGKMQGGGPPGGLGLDKEFFESVMVPEVMLYGFLGFDPSAEGDVLKLTPQIPTDWKALTVDNVRYQGHNLSISFNSEIKSFAITEMGRKESLAEGFYAPGNSILVSLKDK